MAARKNKVSLTDKWKAKIKASVIADRLHKHLMGTVDLSSTQIKAAQILFNKMEPDLARTEMTGKDGKDLPTKVVFEIHGGK